MTESRRAQEVNLMLGRDHALSGAAIFAVVSPLIPGPHLGGLQLAAGVALTAGAALLPDLDHPDSTVALSFGFVTQAFAWLVGKASGGHRHGTHSILGVAVFTAATAWACMYREFRGVAYFDVYLHPVLSWHLLPELLLLTLLYAAGMRALRIGGHWADLIGLAAAAATIWFGWYVDDAKILTFAVGLGCAAHLAGDMLTREGCPLAWPLSRRPFHLSPPFLRFTTGKIAEHWVVGPLLLAGLALAAARDFSLI